MSRLTLFMVSALTLPFGSVSASANDNCTSWGNFTTSASTQMTTLNSPSNNRLSISGALVYRPLLRTEKAYWLGLQLHKATLSVDSNTAKSPFYQVPFAVKIGAQSGQILAYHFAAKLKSEDEQKLIALYQAMHIEHLKHLDLTVPVTVEENDNMGRYKVRYERVDNTSLIRQKLVYLQTTQGSNLFNFKLPEVKADTFNIQQNACWISLLEGENKTYVESEKGDIRINVQQQVSYKTSQQPVPSEALLLTLPLDPKKWPMLPSSVVYPKPAPNPLQDVQTFINTLTALDLASLDEKTLEQLLYDNQAYLLSLQQAIRDGLFNDKALSRLFLKLGQNDSTNAHQLLVDLYLDGEIAPKQRFRSLMALKYIQNPLSEKLAEQIFSQLDSTELSDEEQLLSRSAMMVMGVIAHNQSGSDFAHKVTDTLADKLITTRDQQKQATLLNALGNSRDMRHQDNINKYMSDDNAELRRRAAEALGKMPNPQSLKMLETHLGSEQNNKAKSAILEAMGNNKLSHRQLDTLMAYTQKSASKSLRLSAINAVAKQQSDDVDVKSKLKPLLKKERDQEVLRALMQAIHGGN
ncbi:HEAT repeat domain-containing protein [Pseudoalteromonas sp. MMG022]|uniref:HEAT repeat domain-containing protein n=1 Tax=Pseudoalteromonas sp. MMG022 TaxID=2909978 RepID=UPI001F2BC86C|nr:HEAT repeat domain-containing protein [Pseudoalteromonas sp. MMG022]MCF6437615.1 HEAT repeat domain-containing protein [Pseudoalteromonas sp. MMG022]